LNKGSYICCCRRLLQTPKPQREREKMSSAFLMNPAKIPHAMMQRQFMLVNRAIHPIKTPSFHFLKKPRQYGISSSFCSSSSSSSSSSSAAISISKVGFVGWYLGMIKSWPILTKSVTSSLIYIAADLSSQVSLVSNLFCNCFFFFFSFFLGPLRFCYVEIGKEEML